MATSSLEVTVLRVFTDVRGAFGNKIGLFTSNDVAPEERQQVAAQCRFSETVFVDLPDTSSATAQLHIYSPAVPVPFAGAPALAAAWWLRERGRPVHTLHVPAGVISVEYGNHGVAVRVPSEWAPDLVMHDLPSPDAVAHAEADDYADGFAHCVWSWVDRSLGLVRSRVFAPELGIGEDEATGAAAVRLTEYLGCNLTIVQGHGSVIRTSWSTSGWVWVTGDVVADGAEVLGGPPSGRPAGSTVW